MSFATRNNPPSFHMKRSLLPLLLVPCLVMAATKITDTQIDKSNMTNSVINSTTIGTITPAVGNFSVSHVSGNTGPTLGQGAWTMWNLESTGNTNFVNQRGLGSGGFSWFNANNSGVIGSALMTLDSTGLLSITKVLATGSGVFGSLQATSSANTLSAQGGYLLWNVTGTLGEMDFVAQRGSGVGGFNWYNASGSGVLGSALMTLSNSGVLQASAFVGPLVGSVTGNLNGNAATATAFQTPPTTCRAGLVSIGISSNGNAQCQPWLNRFGWMQTATGSIPGGQYGVQGSYTAWNMAGVGDTDFVNNHGTGPGGYWWFNTDGSTNTTLAFLTNDGTFNSNAASFNTITTSSET